MTAIATRTRGRQPRIDRLFDVTFCDTFAHLYAAEDLDAFLAQLHACEAWEAQLADPAYAYRVAEQNGEPVGYVKVGPARSCRSNRSGPSLLVDQLYVSQGRTTAPASPVR